jgi:hypothetical protein
MLFFALGMLQVRHASITFDEGPHLAIGYATLRTGDLRLQPVHIHPPLANVLAAAPLLLQDDLPDPRTIDGWEIASLSAVTDAVVWSYAEPRRIATAARVPILLLGVLAAAVVCRWARDLGGESAGLLALCIYALDPNIIAHAALITTDTAAVLLSLAMLYALWRFVSDSSPDHRTTRWRKLVATGILLGLAQLAKVSALILVPVSGLSLLLGAWNERRALAPAVLVAAARLAVMLAVAAFSVWAGYGFEIGRVEGWPLPVPAATHFSIFQSLSEHYALGHPTFALGRVSTQGWAWYFPLAFIVKTPLPTVLLGIAALAIAIHTHRTAKAVTANHLLRPSGARSNRFSGSDRAGQAKTKDLCSPQVPGTPEGRGHPGGWTIAIFPLLYAATSLFSSVNIGYRHLLPVLPFVAIGVGVVLTRRSAALGTVLITGLLSWLAVGTLLTLPYPLTFFNELAGGPSNGYRVLVDSNLDWGQNLWDLRDWMEATAERRIAYAHYSPAQPATYGIEADYLPPDPRAVPFAPWRPAPGFYAIGATILQGPYAPELNTYAWFRDREPTARLGHALFVYRVEAQAAPDWALLCAPVTDADGVRRRVGIQGLRVVQPLCDQTLVYAEGAGLTVLVPDGGFPELGERLLSLRTADGETAAEVFSVSGRAIAPRTPAPAGTRFEGPLTFLGYTIPPTPTQAWTYWRVAAVPERPLSLMAHLVAADSTVLAVGDGMGFPLDQWRVGDILVQRHAFESTDGATALQIGGYWLDTLARWPTSGGGDSLTFAVGTTGGN